MGAHNLSGLASFSMRVNGEALPTLTNFLTEYVFYSGFGLDTPVLVITFSDSHNILTGALAINDGTVIELTFGKSDFKYVLSYIVVGVKETKSTSTIIKATAVLNAPTYSFGSQSEAYRGSSASAIESVLNKCNLRMDSDVSPKDSMTWLNVGKSRAKFISDIMKHAYQSDSSCLYGMLDIEGVFIYRDLFKLMSTPKHVVFVGGESDTKLPSYMAVEAKPQAVSGLMNLLSNYGNVVVTPKLDGEIDTHERVKPPVMGDGLPINQSMQESMKYARMEQAHYYDPGTGNMGGSNAHEHYYKARYQNSRFLSLFNQCVRVLINSETDIKLYDTVELRVSQLYGTDTVIDKSSSGLYFVGGRTLVKRGLHYSEIFDLYRCYITESGNTPILGSKNQEASSGKPVVDEVKNSTVNLSDPTNSRDILQQASNKVKALETLSLGGTLEPAPETKSYLDQFISKSTAAIDSLEDQFKQESQNLGSDALADKYGSGKDKLNTLLDEFGAAKSTLEQCGKLSPLESISIKLAKANLRNIMLAVTSRLDRVDALANRIQSDLNNLISKGDISGELIDRPNIRTNCKQFQTDHIEAGIADRFPDKCVDQYSLDRLRLPTDRLRKLKRKLNEYLRNLFCMIGEDS